MPCRFLLAGGAASIALMLTTACAPGLTPQQEVTWDAFKACQKEGAATLEVRARDGFWRPIRLDDRVILSAPVTIDLTPPSLEVLAATHYLHQGGGGLAALRAKGASRVLLSLSHDGDYAMAQALLVGDSPDAGAASI